MEATLSIRWWALALRGVAAVLFGIVALLSPVITLTALIMLFAGYALADGVLNLVSAPTAARHHRRILPVVLESVASIAIGMLTIFWPGLTALALLYVIATRAVLAGILEIAAAIHLRKQVRGEWLMALSGVLSIAFGALLFVFPGAGALTVVIWIGAYSVVSGALLLAVALRLRRWERHHEPLDKHAAPRAARNDTHRAASLAALLCVTAWSTAPAHVRASAPRKAISITSPGDRPRQIMQERIEREREQSMQEPGVEPIAEAVSAIDETRAAVRLIDEKRPADARAALARSLGKIDILLSTHPDTALIPLSVDVRVMDTVADDATVKQVTSEAKNLVNHGRYQTARFLLRNVASEIEIVTVALPVATYPTAIRTASRLLEESRTTEAKAHLLAALRSFVASKRTLALPVVRAQALVEEVSTMAAQDKIDAKEAEALLSEAKRQVELAEKLGYGSRKEDFSALTTMLNDVRETIERKKDSKGPLGKLKDGLQGLKERITKSSQTPAST